MNTKKHAIISSQKTYDLRGNEMKQELVVTVGLPASGKTTWTNELIAKDPNYVNMNRDDVRLMMQGRGRYAKFSKWRENTVTEIMRHGVIAALQNGKSVIVSDTNLNPGLNRNWKDLADDMNVSYREKLFTDITVGECIQRDARRDHPVGSKVIMGMYDRGRQHWWPEMAQDESLPGCYLVDVDGTLAQMNGRGPFEWMKVDTDLPKKDVITVVNMLYDAGNTIIIVSGRDGVCKELTEEWLDDNGVQRHGFYIRPAGDNRKDTLIKEEIYHRHIKGRYNVKGVFDDRDQVVHMWRHLGLTVFQVNYGDF